MQERNKDRKRYFYELAESSKNFFIPYIEKFHKISPDSKILEVGCGDGGNLLPFSKRGCHTLGVDMAESRIMCAKNMFKTNNVKGDFIASNIFHLANTEHQYDVILCHDVIEHIPDKEKLLATLHDFLAKDGVIFLAFPAWMMPFGGHQQICSNRLLSHAPFIHLLPRFLYKAILKTGHEDDGCVKELMSIRNTRLTIEHFEQIIAQTNCLKIADRTLWLINPHYKTKFGLTPRLLPKLIVKLPYIRDFFTTSCFYILTAYKN